MDDPSRTWQVERAAPMRADAESMFLPVADLAEAAIGDRVRIRGHEPGQERTGAIVATGEHDGERFFRVELDA